MPRLDDLKNANLSSENLENIRALETKLDPDIFLVAVEAKNSIYVLEAKITPNAWERVDKVYPEIKDLQGCYAEQDAAKEAKGWLKNFLADNNLNPRPKKRPIRIRQKPRTAFAGTQKIYQLLSENLIDDIWILNVETNRFRYISPSIQPMRGYTVDEVMNKKRYTICSIGHLNP